MYTSWSKVQCKETAYLCLIKLPSLGLMKSSLSFETSGKHASYVVLYNYWKTCTIVYRVWFVSNEKFIPSEQLEFNSESLVWSFSQLIFFRTITKIQLLSCSSLAKMSYEKSERNSLLNLLVHTFIIIQEKFRKIVESSHACTINILQRLPVAMVTD